MWKRIVVLFLAKVNEIDIGKECVNYKKSTGKNAEYQGMQGVCDYCHSNLLRIDEEGNVFCPQCNVKAEVEVVDGKLKVHFTQDELDKSRWGVYGQKLHFDNIAKGHKRAVEGSDQIKETYQNEYKELVKEMRMTVPKLYS